MLTVKYFNPGLQNMVKEKKNKNYYYHDYYLKYLALKAGQIRQGCRTTGTLTQAIKQPHGIYRLAGHVFKRAQCTVGRCEQHYFYYHYYYYRLTTAIKQKRVNCSRYTFCYAVPSTSSGLAIPVNCFRY